ncbi:unnamed protein product, partial [Urochloa humidicola]
SQKVLSESHKTNSKEGPHNLTLPYRHQQTTMAGYEINDHSAHSSLKVASNFSLSNTTGPRPAPASPTSRYINQPTMS